MDAKIIDFWSFFNQITSNLPEVKSYSDDELNLLFDEKISEIKKAVISNGQMGLKCISDNLGICIVRIETIIYYRNLEPGNPNLARLQSVLTGLFDYLFRILGHYYPERLKEERLLLIAEKYCSTHIFQYLEDINQYPQENSHRPTPEPQTLKDIWKGTPNQYNKLINDLRKPTDWFEYQPVIDKENEFLPWIGKRLQYARGLFYALIQNDFIEEGFSGMKYLDIFNNTFQPEIKKSNDKQFRNLKISPPELVYYQYFDELLMKL